mgnify:CR=1 FL=1
MTLRQALPRCDECGKQVVQSRHAILGGKIYCLCSESCRRVCRARRARRRPEPAAEGGKDFGGNPLLSLLRGTYETR